MKNEENNPIFGYTGDTEWEAGLGRKFGKCRVLLMNLGYIEGIDLKPHKHLGKDGICNMICEIFETNKSQGPELFLIGEWMFDALHARSAITQEIEQECQDRLHRKRLPFKIIPADLGLEASFGRDIKMTMITRKGKSYHVAHSPTTAIYRDCPGRITGSICYSHKN